MQSKSVYKIPKGKLLKIFLKYDKKSNSINKINITGDFFAYPEETIEFMENALEGTILKKDILFNKIDTIIREKKIQFIGLNAKDLTIGIMMCKK
jgi:lipoate-protein ligase A